MKMSIGWAIAVVTPAALLLAALCWFFRGEELLYEAVPGSGHALMAAYVDQAAEEIVREERLDRQAYCLRVPVWAEQHDDGCVLVRPALVGQWRQCTPYRALNGHCSAIEMSEALLQNDRIRDLLFVRMADICLYTTNPTPRTARGAHSVDCMSPGREYQVRRIEPMLCVFVLDENEEPAAPAVAVRRGREVQDHWCKEWEKLVRARSQAQPRDCWLGVARPAPGGGTFTGCRRD
jgi:hypothetical protein